MDASGIAQMISLLLGLAGFGLHPDPKPPTVDAALEYAVADPDFVVQVDVTSLVTGNYRALLALPDDPQLKGAELQPMLRQMIGQLEGGRGAARLATGIDPTTDVSDATVFVTLAPHGDPSFLVAAHGKFTTQNVDKIAATSHRKASPLGGGSWVELDDKASVGVTKDHVMLAGTTPWVRDRMADGWKAPPHGAGTSLAYAAQMIDGKPVLAALMTLSAAARAQVAHAGGDVPAFLADVVARHKAASFSVYIDGAGWTWVDSTKAGVEDMATMSDGFVDLLRAAQIAPRGIAKIFLGALDSYRAEPRVATLLKHRDDLMKIVAMYTSDGNFKVKVDRDAAHNALSVRATGKTASEVLPIAMIGPAAAFGALMAVSMRGSLQAVPPAPPHVAPPATTGRHP